MTEIDVDISFGPVTSMPVSAALAGAILVTGPVELYGWSIIETSGAAAATCTFMSGNSIIGEASMAAGQSNNNSLPSAGVYCPQGISIGAVTGAFTGCVYVRVYRP